MCVCVCVCERENVCIDVYRISPKHEEEVASIPQLIQVLLTLDSFSFSHSSTDQYSLLLIVQVGFKRLTS